MKIELRNVKYAAFASQETSCFSADVWIDGKKAGFAENDGHGGMTFISPRETEQRINEYAKTLPVVVTEWNDPNDRDEPFSYQPDAESVVNDLLDEWLTLRDYKKAVAKRILWTRAGSKGIYQTKALGAVDLQRNLADPKIKEKLLADCILNTLSMDEGFAIYKARA